MSRLALILITALLVMAGCDRAPDMTAPPVTGELLAGGSYDPATQRGQVVVINFWASWCAPCRAEIDDLEAVFQATKGKGVTFVGIDIRDPDRDKAKAFVDGRISYPSIYDPAGKLSVAFSRFGATTIPATVVVDRDGRVAHVLREAVTREKLEPLVTGVAGG
jgi:thiol-disulfide isomerase/thioredoxin